MNCFYLLFALLGLCAAVCDFLFFRIPNTVVLSILGLFVLKTLIFQDISYPYMPFLVGIGAIILGYFAFSFKLMGGGDAKFLSVAAMWAAQVDFLSFMLVVTISGGAIALIYSKYSAWVTLSRVWVITALRNAFGKDKFISIFGKDSLNTLTKISTGADYQSQRMIPYGIPTFFGCFFITIIKILG